MLWLQSGCESLDKTLFNFLSAPSGYRVAVQCSQSRQTITIGTSCEKVGSLFGVWGRDVNFATVLLHAGCALVGLYLVLHRSYRCRQWGE